MKKVMFAALAAILSLSNVQAQEKYQWQNPKLPTQQRVESLLSMLTPEEKVGLMVNKSISVDRLGIPS
jgi:beta-glucosidase